jgi:CO2 hydration protein
MIKTPHPLAQYVDRLQSGRSLLLDNPQNLQEVVGILDSYGHVLDAYQKNLLWIAEGEFLNAWPFFKYFNDGKIGFKQLVKHIWHDRLNLEYAEYCMKNMLWHGGGRLDTYIESPEFRAQMEPAIQAKIRKNPLMQLLHRIFPEFLPEQVRQMVYYNVLGQFWEVMSGLFLGMSDAYNQGKITCIPDVVKYIQAALVGGENLPITYSVTIDGQSYDILPAAEDFKFLMDVGVPYAEAVFFRGTPFLGTVSLNAQAGYVPVEQDQFCYGVLYGDPLPIGGSGVPPTLLMQDMRHTLPPYLYEIYQNTPSKDKDLLVKIFCSFQKSMYCVTNAVIVHLAPHPLDTTDPKLQAENGKYFEGWLDRFVGSRLPAMQE